MAMNYRDNRESKLEMLKWISEKNAHVPLAELAFLLDLPMAEVPSREEASYEWN